MEIYPDLAQLSGKIAGFQNQIASRNRSSFAGICGFDGFIDTFIQMQSPATLALFGAKVQAAAGMAASYPVHHLGDKFGGNGPLLAAALHGVFCGAVDITYIGALGKGTVLPIFEEALAGKMKRLFTLAEPAHSDCIEFKDGKIMLSDMRSCAEIHWERLLECVGQETLDALLKESRFVAAVNWGKLIHVGTIWEAIANRLSALGIAKKEVVFFMDLAEFEQRPRQDRLELVDLVGKITAQCHTLLSFNLKEAWQMADEFQGNFHGKKAPGDVAELAALWGEGKLPERL